MKADVLVVGAGHAGIEAAAAAVRTGARTVLVTQDLAAVGRLSCNPAVGGLAKGQLVREIDALGGWMGRLADACAIHVRMLNASRGPAVQGLRAQQDLQRYGCLARSWLEAQPGLTLMEGEVTEFTRRRTGWRVAVKGHPSVEAVAVVVTTGTFACGELFRGVDRWAGGRLGEPPATAVSGALRDLGFELRRLKTGTPPRIDPDSIDWSLAQEQPGDLLPGRFSERSVHAPTDAVLCHIVRTSLTTHEILRRGFSQSPLFSGMIVGSGPRYCPSIEDKIRRFGDRNGHQLFMEPEGRGRCLVYVNGFSTSLPASVQLEALRTIPALARCTVVRYGYAVEYDAVDATALHPGLGARNNPGFFVAGQTCGTSGYEEAAAQGIVAGLNAARYAQGRNPWIPTRSDGYLGVLLHDLTAVFQPEPYRLFTSRAEHRLFLRHDNAPHRLTPIGRELGLIDDAHWALHLHRRAAEDRARGELGRLRLPGGGAALDLLRRPDEDPWTKLSAIPELQTAIADLDDDQKRHLRAEELYGAFRLRASRSMERVRRLGALRLPMNWTPDLLAGVSNESGEILRSRRPATLEEASLLPGVRSADIEVLLVRLGH